MADQTTYLEVVVPDPAGTQKTLRAAEGLEQLAQTVAKVLSVNLGSETSPYTIPYSATEGGTKTGIHFAVLRLTGVAAGAFDVIVPDLDHTFIVDNQCGQTVTVKTAAGSGVAVTNTNRKLVFCDGSDVLALT